MRTSREVQPTDTQKLLHSVYNDKGVLNNQRLLIFPWTMLLNYFLMILVPCRASESICFIDFYEDLSESLYSLWHSFITWVCVGFADLEGTQGLKEQFDSMHVMSKNHLIKVWSLNICISSSMFKTPVNTKDHRPLIGELAVAFHVCLC